MEKNKNIVFRRVRGRIVPIQLKKSDISPQKTAAVGAVAASSYYAGKSVGTFYKKAKTLFQSSLGVPQGLQTLTKTGRKLKKPKAVHNIGQTTLFTGKAPLLNAAQTKARRIGQFKMGLGGFAKSILVAGSALALGELLASTQKKKADKKQALAAGATTGFALSTYGFARGVIKPKAAARYALKALKGLKRIL